VLVRVVLFCRFVPIAPDLEGDVDLTRQQPPADAPDPQPNSPPPISAESNGLG
jgi:hypothetical protein